MAELAIQTSKIPDPIKMLPTYEGDPKTLNHWIRISEAVLGTYDNIRLENPAIFNIWVLAVRQKIIGKANEALVSRNINVEWPLIRGTLIEYFGDRRDLSTLSSQIPYLRQGKKSLDEYYKETTELTANINTKVALDARFPEAMQINAVMTFVRDLTKSAFIDGLNEPFNLTVRSFRPETLEAAKSAAEEQIQSIQRSKSFNPISDGKTVFAQAHQRAPKKSQNYQQNQRGNHQFSNSGQRQNNPQNSNPNRNHNGNYNGNFNGNYNGNFDGNFNANNRQNNANNYQRNYQNNPQRQMQNQNATPMEVDASMRSRQSAQPMSISARNYQIANVEQNLDTEFDQEPYENNDDSYEQNEENVDDEVNFHIVIGNDSKG